MNLRWIPVADSRALEGEACRRILDAASRAIAQRGRFLLVLSGGDTPRGVYARLRDAAADWPRWSAWFGDERCLPAGNAQRNSTMAQTAWLDHVPIGEVHAIPAELGAQPAAHAYAQALRGIGDFDLVLLGLGEDGHTASLFPGHDWGAGDGAPDVLAVLDAPKPPPERVSLSAARLCRAREVLFMVAGANKREALARWRADDDIPARAIRSPGGVDVLVEAGLLG
jgi:6-phosphogluconolactonase